MSNDELNILRKIAWSYVKSFPGWEFDEVLSEACVAYLSCRDKYDESRGALSTFVWVVVRNHFYGILRKRECERRRTTLLDEACARQPDCESERLFEWIEFCASLSPQANFVISLLSSTEDDRKAKKEITTKLEEEYSWTKNDVRKAFHELKTVIVQ